MLRVFRRPAVFAGASHPIPARPGFDNIIDLSAFRKRAPTPVGRAPPCATARIAVFRPVLASERSNSAPPRRSFWDRAHALIDRLEVEAQERNALHKERVLRRAVERQKTPEAVRIRDLRPL